MKEIALQEASGFCIKHLLNSCRDMKLWKQHGCQLLENLWYLWRNCFWFLFYLFFLNKELTYVPSKFYALPVLKTSGTEATLNLSSQNYGHLSSAIKPCLMQLLQNTPLKPIAKACKKKNI